MPPRETPLGNAAGQTPKLKGAASRFQENLLEKARRMRAAEGNFGKIARGAVKPFTRLITGTLSYRR